MGDKRPPLNAGIAVVGGGGVQHRERSSSATAALEDHGVLRAEGETDRTAEENVSKKAI